MRSEKPAPQRSAALLGLAFDAKDGQKRITRGENFLLAGGSEATHGVMQETAIKVTERLDERGKHLADVSADELRDVARKNGMITLRDAGMRAAYAGTTTTEEVVRETIIDA